MKVEPSPTSPKVPRVHTEFPHRFALILLVAGAGIAGGVFDIFLHSLAYQFPDFPFLKVFVASPSSSQEVVLVKGEDAQANEAALRSLQQNILPKTVALYESPSSFGSDAPTLLSPELFRGHALLITTDGLVLTTKNVLRDAAASYIAVTHDRRVLSVSGIFQDPASAFVFARIDGKDFSVSDFGSLSEVLPGETVYIVSHHGFSSEAAIASGHLVTPHVFDAKDIASALHSSDAFDREAMLDIPFQPELESAAVLNTDGKVVGVVRGESGKTRVIPTKYISTTFEEAIRNHRLSRASLGAHYLDLAEPLVVGTAKDIHRGAMLFGTPSTPAITPKSPAARAGLQEGDIVLRVNGNEIAEGASLNEYILQAQPGARVKLVFVRGGEEREVILTLDASPL